MDDGEQGLHAGEHLQESFPVLQQVFLASLKDSSAEVRRTALQAVASMVPWLDEEPHIALFKDLVPLTIQVSPSHFTPHHASRPHPTVCTTAAAVMTHHPHQLDGAWQQHVHKRQICCARYTCAPSGCMSMLTSMGLAAVYQSSLAAWL